jgi:hypothetical protein
MTNGSVVADPRAPGFLGRVGEDVAGDIFGLNGALIAEFSPAGALQPQVTPSPITRASTIGFQVASAVFQAVGRYLAGGGVDLVLIRYLGQ